MVLRHRRPCIWSARAAPVVVRGTRCDPTCRLLSAARPGAPESAVSGTADAERSPLGRAFPHRQGLHEDAAGSRSPAGVLTRGGHGTSRRGDRRTAAHSTRGIDRGVRRTRLAAPRRAVIGPPRWLVVGGDAACRRRRFPGSVSPGSGHPIRCCTDLARYAGTGAQRRPPAHRRPGSPCGRPRPSRDSDHRQGSFGSRGGTARRHLLLARDATAMG